MSLDKLKSEWQDTPEYHSKIKEKFDVKVNADIELKELRDWVEQNAFGFGERCFYEMWNLIVQEMPKDSTFLELGLFRGQTLALIELLSVRHKKDITRYGVSPLDSTDGHWESNYKQDIETIHDKFGLENSYIIHQSLSTDPDTIETMSLFDFDVVYIDGGHQYDVVVSDLKHYSPLVKLGGLLVIDDANCDMHMPWGFFQGIEDVTKATLEWHEENKDEFEFMFNVVHNRVFRRVK